MSFLTLSEFLALPSKFFAGNITKDEVVAEFNKILENNNEHRKIKKPKPGNTICKKCGSNLIWVDGYQLRSADEGQTSVFKCSECFAVWRLE